MNGVRVGCCGCPVARPKYYETFESVEIQQTFYQLPQSETARRWRAEAPEGFLFTLKAWQLVTHESTSPTYRRLKLEITPTQEKCYCFFKPTDEVFAAGLKAKWLLFQSPASFTPGRRNKKNRVRFFSSLNRKGMDLIWEPRGKWGEDEVKELCKELDLVHCVDPLKNFPSYGRFRYFRLHG